MQYIQNDALVSVDVPPINIQQKQARSRYAFRITLWLALFAFGILSLVTNPLELNSTLATFASTYLPEAYMLTVRYAVALIVLIPSPFGIYLTTRQHLARPHHWRTHCPSCLDDSLHRQPRRRSDRIVGKLLRLPLFHYHCASCDWQGRRTEHGLL